MKRIIVIVLSIILILAIIGYLWESGVLQDLEWETLSMIAAAAAGPYMAFKNWILHKDNTDRIIDKHSLIEKKEKIHRSDTDEKIKERENKIKELNKEIELLDTKVELLEAKKTKIDKEVKDMSLDEVKNEAVNLFGS